MLLGKGLSFAFLSAAATLSTYRTPGGTLGPGAVGLKVSRTCQGHTTHLGDLPQIPWAPPAFLHKAQEGRPLQTNLFPSG